MWGQNSKTKHPKILIVEDDETNHLLFKEVFSQAGFEVIISQNADGGFVEDVVALAPDIISMDLMIGKAGVELQHDGFSTMGLLKQDERTKDIPIIVLSNFHEETKIERAKALGAVDYIMQPSHAIETIPKQFLSYLKNPKKYQPLHPAFK